LNKISTESSKPPGPFHARPQAQQKVASGKRSAATGEVLISARPCRARRVFTDFCAPLQGAIVLFSGIPVAARCALATGYHPPRLRRSSLAPPATNISLLPEWKPQSNC